MTEDGDGVGLDASSQLSVAVPFAVPGDKLSVELWEEDLLPRRDGKERRKPLTTIFGNQVDLLEPSDHRVTPACSKYFGSCGGCKHQHVSYETQLQQKQERVQALFANAQLPIFELLPIQGVPDHDALSQYRNKMEFTCSTGRWLLRSEAKQQGDAVENTDSDVVDPKAEKSLFTIGLFPVTTASARRARQFGFRRRGKLVAAWSPRILSIDECLLQDPACNSLLQRLTALCEDAGVEAYKFQNHQGFLKQVVLRRGSYMGTPEIMLGLVTTSFEGPQNELLQGIVDALTAEFQLSEAPEGGLVSIVQRLDEEALRHQGLSHLEGSERVLYGRNFLRDTILDHSFQLSFDSFFQPNTAQASALYREIQKTLKHKFPVKKPIVWDLFCGVGSIGICMGEFAERVVGFEIVEAAVTSARANAAANGYSDQQMQFFCLDLTKPWDENELTERLGSAERPDLVIVDPPRAGLHSKLIKLLHKLAPKQICYVSCNPHTQVRDLEMLCLDKDEAYTLESVQPVDMLPHTPHIETIAWLHRTN